MNTYKISIIDDYVLIEIDNKKYLFDTGAYSLAKTNQIEINNNSYNVLPLAKFENILCETFNQKIEGLIGKDIVSQLGSVEVDLLNKTICFGTITKPLNNVFSITNDFMTNIKVNNKLARAYLDTGSHIMMAQNKEFLSNLKILGQIKEASFTVTKNLNVCEAIIEIGSFKKTIRVLEHDEMPSSPNIDVYFSLNQIANEYYGISLLKGICYFK